MVIHKKWVRELQKKKTSNIYHLENDDLLTSIYIIPISIKLLIHTVSTVGYKNNQNIIFHISQNEHN